MEILIFHRNPAGELRTPITILDFAILNSDIPIDLISIFVLYVHRNVPIQLQPLHLLTSRLPLKDHADLSRFLGPN